MVRHASVDSHGVVINVYRRDTGKLVGSKEITERLGEAPALVAPGYVLVTESMLYAESPWPVDTKKKGTITRPDLILRWRREADKVVFDEPVVGNFELPLAHHALGTSALIRDPELTWALLEGDKWTRLARVSKQPDLFTSRVPPTVVGDIVYFGNFAVDLATREILWKLPVKNVSFAAVPTDRLVLVVDQGAVLRAFRERRGP